jgi:flavin-dependent dehydrogenase
LSRGDGATEVVDVAVVGGGPGGGATALSLRRHAPALRVALYEASRYAEPRIGETLPPPARGVLEHLGVWDAFTAQGHREVHGTVAAWGNAAPHDNDYLVHARGAGWHLDRTAFDRHLAAAAERAGAAVRRGVRVRRVSRQGDGWALAAADGSRLRARAVVDATGRSAAVARRLGARAVAVDRLVGLARTYREAPGDADPRSLVEAFADGWWYTAGLPGGERLVVLMTDADVARRLGLRDVAAWESRLAATRHVAPLVRGARPRGPVFVRPAASRHLDPAAGGDAGAPWLAVGDAASAHDPLSSQGIAKALRAGIFAAYALADHLLRGDATALPRYRAFVENEIRAYLEARARTYAEERRFPAHDFWRRRVA